MILRVLQPPLPIVSPSDLGIVPVDDVVAESIISAVTAEFDGPLGKLGRCFGPQTLIAEVAAASHIFLPCPPVIEVISVSYQGAGGQVVAETSDYFLEAGCVRFSNRSFWLGVPCGRSLTIHYRAGFDGQETGTGVMPSQIRQAIILKSRLIASAVSGEASVKAAEVEGIGRREYTLPEQISAMIDKAVDGLLCGLKVHRL